MKVDYRVGLGWGYFVEYVFKGGLRKGCHVTSCFTRRNRYTYSYFSFSNGTEAYFGIIGIYEMRKGEFRREEMELMRQICNGHDGRISCD
jgi:hypothetical protein